VIKQAAYWTATPDASGSRAATIRLFVGIAIVCFVLRITYAGGIYQDDGFWFTVAEEILRGKVLYREIFFDKPPGLAFVYAGLFKIFGAHIITVRLFTICFSLLISAVLYVFGSRLYDRRVGLIAAAIFSVFSTTYVSGDMQSLNTDFLMVPFYAAGAYLLIRSGATLIRLGRMDGRAARLALSGGALSGVAFQINPKGALDLIFLVLFLIAARSWHVREVETNGRDATGSAKPLSTGQYFVAASKLLALAVTGLVLASLPFLLYVSSTQALSQYKLYVWDWGFRYASYYPASRAAEIFLRYGTDYFLINNTLFIALVVTAAATLRRAWLNSRERKLSGGEKLDGRESSSDAGDFFTFRSDATLLIWFAVSFFGVATGGRFFAHYYFLGLPSLCLIGARGLVLIISALQARNRQLSALAISLLTVGFFYTLGRTHQDTARLALDWIRGTSSRINREARIVAATVRDIADPADTVDRVGVEAIREGGPRMRSSDGPCDFLFVWGNWPEVYYWSGLLPASRYLSTQPLTGVPADVQYGGAGYRVILDASLTAAARAELVRDLERTPPKYVVDELGFRDSELSIMRYSELQEFMNNYERRSSDVSIPIYVRRNENRDH